MGKKNRIKHKPVELFPVVGVIRLTPDELAAVATVANLPTTMVPSTVSGFWLNFCTKLNQASADIERQMKQRGKDKK